MCYDNSELLKNYVHGYQATGEQFFADVARDIIRWMDEWLSDRDRGGFYASQDADINMDDDGDYFTWTLDEARAVLTKEEVEAAVLHYDINEVGEMHHNPAKNVLYVRASVDEIAGRMKLSTERVTEVLASAKKKMYTARLLRPTPYVDKTVYVGWNSLCISAYLEAAKVLALTDARRFALPSLDRILAEAWKKSSGQDAQNRAGESPTPTRAALLHVVSYSDPAASHREVPGMLEDYAFTALACLDAYEATADLSYWKAYQAITDSMRSQDSTTRPPEVSSTANRRPTAKALACWQRGANPCRTHRPRRGIRWRQSRYCGCTITPATRVIGTRGNRLWKLSLALRSSSESSPRPTEPQSSTTWRARCRWSAFPTEKMIRMPQKSSTLQRLGRLPSRDPRSESQPIRATAQNLPPGLASTIPHIPGLGSGKSFAVLCSGSSCQPPITDAVELQNALRTALGKSPA